MKKPILALPRNSLFTTNEFQGFQSHQIFDYGSIILDPSNRADYQERESVEQDPLWKQPIPYVVVINPRTQQVYAYQRNVKDAHYTEKRLQGKWSLGVGGHVEHVDNHSTNPLYECALREVTEEIKGIEETISPRLFGYINDDADPVGQVHFGLVYVLETDSLDVRPRDQEMMSGRLHSIEELDEIVASAEHEVEGWSSIIWPFVRERVLKP